MKTQDRINQWKKRLRSHSHFDDGMIAEMETHLLDQMEDLIHQGMSEPEAFEEALNRIGDIGQIGKQEKQVQLRSTGFANGLFLNFTKTARRQFSQNIVLNGINMLGLVLAFTAILFIALNVNDELNYEKHHPASDQIYRLAYTQVFENGEKEERAFSSGNWSGIVTDRVAGVSSTFRFLNLSYGFIENPKTQGFFYEEGIYWSDENIFDFLNLPLKHGRKADQLNSLNSIVLTEKTAQKIFGTDNPIGQQLNYNRQGNSVNFVVTGVIYDPPTNSQFRPDYIAHIQAAQGIYGERNRGWVDRNPNPGYVFTYFKAPNKETVEQVESELSKYWQEVMPQRADRLESLITPLTHIHFNEPVKWEMDNPISMSYLYGLIGIAAFILIIALTNFVNLTTAQAGKRQKEIGLRKTLGSSKFQLKLQFFLESFWSVLLAMLIAVALVVILTPEFNKLIDKRIDIFQVLNTPNNYIALILFTLFISSVCGQLPAQYFTRKLSKNFSINSFLKEKREKTKSRNMLVIVQFAAAIILIISTLTIFQQLQLINGGTLATHRNSIIGVRTSRMGSAAQAQKFRQEIETLAGVSSSTLGMHLPRQSDFGRINTKYFAPSISQDPLYWNKFDADGDFAKTFDLEFVAGRDFRDDYELHSLILNEQAVDQLGLTADEAIGLVLEEDSINYVFGRSNGQVIGVVKDFNYKSMKERIEPLVICANTLVEGALSVKLETSDPMVQISQMEEKWKSIYPQRPFEFWFLDKEFERLYQQERRLGSLIPIFSGLAITVALLGLFALTAFIVNTRKKEIGIRKVLGSSVSDIFILLGKQYFLILFVGLMIGVPVAFLTMNEWLNEFTYRVNISAGLVLISVLFIFTVSFLTISIKTVRAAKANPVDSLKYE